MWTRAKLAIFYLRVLGDKALSQEGENEFLFEEIRHQIFNPKAQQDVVIQRARGAQHSTWRATDIELTGFPHGALHYSASVNSRVRSDVVGRLSQCL